MEIQPEDFETFRADPQTAFEQRFRSLPGMAVRMRDATLEGKVQGTRGIANYFRTPYGPGWALTGDAAYLIDPITGWASATPSRNPFCWPTRSLPRCTAPTGRRASASTSASATPRCCRCSRPP